MDTSISEFNEKFYILEIKHLAFHLPHIQILCTQHCGKEHCEVFKCWGYFKDVPFRHEYAECVVASFENQIKSEYYSSNQYVSIEGIELEQYKQLRQTQIGCEPGKPRRRAVFH